MQVPRVKRRNDPTRFQKGKHPGHKRVARWQTCSEWYDSAGKVDRKAGCNLRSQLLRFMNSAEIALVMLCDSIRYGQDVSMRSFN